MNKTKCLITDEGRECCTCGRYLPREFFSYSNDHHPHGRCSKCKRCSSLYQKWKPGYVIDYVHGTLVEKSEIKDVDSFPVKYPAPNIDEVINFKPIVIKHERE